MTYEEIKAAWNAQADESNQWDELGEDEKIEWAASSAAAKEREAGFHVLDKPLLVHIEWRDPESDWPWFRLLATRGEWLHLQGADYPDGSWKHCGDCFWVHKSDVRTMDGNAWTTNNSTPV